jgi:hypothetical protein
LGPNILLSILFSHSLGLCFFHNPSSSFKPTQNNGQNYSSV